MLVQKLQLTKLFTTWFQWIPVTHGSADMPMWARSFQKIQLSSVAAERVFQSSFGKQQEQSLEDFVMIQCNYWNDD